MYFYAVMKQHKILFVSVNTVDEQTATDGNVWNSGLIQMQLDFATETIDWKDLHPPVMPMAPYLSTIWLRPYSF